MLCTGNDYEVESYKEYKNRSFKKHIDKMNNQLQQIKDCSLKPIDKKMLKLKMLELINSTFQ